MNYRWPTRHSPIYLKDHVTDNFSKVFWWVRDVWTMYGIRQMIGNSPRRASEETEKKKNVNNTGEDGRKDVIRAIKIRVVVFKFTLKLCKSWTTQVSRASLPTITVTLGTGSGNHGRLKSETNNYPRIIDDGYTHACTDRVSGKSVNDFVRAGHVETHRCGKNAPANIM